MKLATFAAGLAIAAGIMVVGGHSVSAQGVNSQQTQTESKPAPVTVVVNPGDSLTAIANAHQTTYRRIFDANTDIVNPDLIYPGQNLRIPDASEQLAEREIPADYAAVADAQTSYVPQTQSQAVASLPAAQTAPQSGCGDNQYANFIYMHESGCRTTAMSPNGCYGIGQACPASKIAYCGADYACQNAFFSAYAGKYGGWAGAYDFWLSHGWW